MKKFRVFLKVSPDETFSSLEKIIEIALSRNISGIIATNTEITVQVQINIFKKAGGVEVVILKKANAIIKFIAQITNNNLPIIGVGGVCDANTAIRKLDLGASLVQLYTSFIYEVQDCLKKFFWASKKEIHGLHNFTPIYSLSCEK